jgi:hypothetical protein
MRAPGQGNWNPGLANAPGSPVGLSFVYSRVYVRLCFTKVSPAANQIGPNGARPCLHCRWGAEAGPKRLLYSTGPGKGQ